MPFYDYRCEDCGHEFEEQRPVAARDEAECPGCRGRRVRRLVRAVARLSGAGGGPSGGASCSPAGRSGFG
jgi:putative FmdB family regulatory protein